MNQVFLLQHLHVFEDGKEDLKTIGIYSSKEEALSAIDRKSKEEGFKDHPKLIDPDRDDYVSGFYLDFMEVDKDQWTEGYFTV